MKLKYKYLSISLVVALLPLILAMGVALFHSEKIAHDLTISTVQVRLALSAEQISGFFQTRSSEIQSYASSPLLRSMDWKRIRPFLRSELEKHVSIYEKFILGDPAAQFYNTAGGNPRFGGLRTFNDTGTITSPRSIKNRIYWQHTVGNNKNGDMRLYISDPIISYTTGVTQVVIASTIMSRDRTVAGMLGGTVAWERIESLVNNARNRFIEDYGDTAKLFMVSHTGTYVYHWNNSKIIRIMHDEKGNKILDELGEKKTVSHRIIDEPVAKLSSAGKKMLQGKSGFSSYRDPESGLSMFIVYAPVKSADYSMALVIPESTVLIPVRALRWTLLGILCASVLLVLLVAPIMAGRISSPITALSNAVRKFSMTGDTGEISTGNSDDEIDFLTKSTMEMMYTIRERELSLKKSEEMNRLLVRYSPVGIIYYDTDMRITECNERFVSLLNTTRENLIGLDMRQLNDRSILPTLEKALEGKDSHMEGPYRATTGNAFIYMSLRCAAVFNENGEVRGAIGIVEDITERNISEKSLLSSLEEKETLLRELYHRTKNNMQVVYSLLSLQADRITDSSTRAVLEATGTRIMAMALVHQKLYQSESLSRVNLAEYITEFANLLLDSFQGDDKISLEMDLDPIPVLIDTAIPCGLVLNELLTNSLRHAFTGSAEGIISIRLKRFDEKGIHLFYRDDGQGASAGFNFRESGGLGYQIIYSIVEHQLQGTISVENSRGISCGINFTDHLYRERV